MADFSVALGAAATGLKVGLQLLEAALQAWENKETDKAREFALAAYKELEPALAQLMPELLAIAVANHKLADQEFPLPVGAAGGGPAVMGGGPATGIMTGLLSDEGKDAGE